MYGKIPKGGKGAKFLKFQNLGDYEEFFCSCTILLFRVAGGQFIYL